MSVATLTATVDWPTGVNDLHIKFESAVTVTGINGHDPNARPPAKNAPTVQGGGAGGAPPSDEVTITFDTPVPDKGSVSVGVATTNNKAINGNYKWTKDNK